MAPHATQEIRILEYSRTTTYLYGGGALNRDGRTFSLSKQNGPGFPGPFLTALFYFTVNVLLTEPPPLVTSTTPTVPTARPEGTFTLTWVLDHEV